MGLILNVLNSELWFGPQISVTCP